MGRIGKGNEFKRNEKEEFFAAFIRCVPYSLPVSENLSSGLCEFLHANRAPAPYV